MSHEINKYGWIKLYIPENAELAAKKNRKERDAEYGNIYYEKESDERWVGDLGEFAFKSWLKSQNIEGYKWLLKNAAGKADFIMSNSSTVDVKTVKRKVAPLPYYTAQITAQHIDENVDHYFFMSYEYDKKQMWFLGGITKANFKKHAKYYAEGEDVHSNYTIREGHEIYNIEIDKLIPPIEWIKQFTT